MTEAANSSLAEINARLARLENAMAGGADRQASRACLPQDCPHKQRLKNTILEIIGALEASRRAFHSRQLEQLRGKLTRDLAALD
jgi:hypothetical protein